MRLTFPQDRTSFIYQGALQPILTPPRTGVAIYADPSGTELADVLTLDGLPINDATVHTGEDGLLPEFLGPDDDSMTLWVRVLGSAALYPVQARAQDMLAALLRDYQAEEQTSALIWGHGPPSLSDGVENSFYVDLDAVPQTMWGPKRHNGTWPPEPLRFGLTEIPDFPVVPLPTDHQIMLPTMEYVIDTDLVYPTVTYRDPEGDEAGCDVTYPTPTRVVVRFGSPCTGSVHLSP